MLLIDSHCHFDATAFDADRAAAYARAVAAGVAVQIVPAVTAASWPTLKQVCADYPGLYPAYGLHPMFIAQHRPEHLHSLRVWIEREAPVAIGECGLDFFVDGLDAQTQQASFDAQLRLARDFDLPVIVHARRAVDAVIASIRNVGGLRGVVHSFPGSQEQAMQLHQLGFLLGIGGPLTFARANRLRKLVAHMPLEQLLLETDAPDQPGALHRGQRNEPAHLLEVLAVVASLRNTSHEVIAAATTANAQRLFKLPVLASATSQAPCLPPQTQTPQ
ncbi:MAG TPA: TatD family hydrolase [Thermomonas sp.]|mgnify:FL=1|jgi:TatD DNase family protein|uniref:TatD family hydrolase n=1 Tax=Thermomonas sp. TaxID=1971895 RepID=UPI002B93B4FF|nr:TatD family hydrolase [Thermomonas sp.]HOV95525.1 TatD family hydrolase [Thermomonas sp.]